jgi:hypothetical protein
MRTFTVSNSLTPSAMSGEFAIITNHEMLASPTSAQQRSGHRHSRTWARASRLLMHPAKKCFP